MAFHDIPNEMRLFSQWICWRYEETSGGKPTKIPYCPHSTQLANVNNPQTWGTFEQAISAAQHASGIGFVLTENDPYAFIDLDDPFALNPDGTPKYPNGKEILDRQIQAYTQFASYSERSPSGTGLHIIVKGNVPAGRRRNAIEVYSSQRYMTMTGDVYRNAPIEERQEQLTQLWEQLGGFRNVDNTTLDEPQRFDDATIIDRACKAANGAKFEALLKGQWSAYYPSQSEADFAFVDMLAFYTQSREQIARLFLQSPLGLRDKAKRRDYIAHMISRSFDRILPPIDTEGLSNQLSLALEAKKAKQAQAQTEPKAEPQGQLILPGVVKEKPKHLLNVPPGLMGHIARFIYAASPRPVPEIALAAAIGLMAGICGRAYNVSRTGLNSYVLLLASTGTGKEAMSGGIDRLMNAIRTTVPASQSFIGPGDIMSGQALLKYLSRVSQYPCFVSVVGEFGLVLKQLSSPFANSSQNQLQKMIRDLYNKSGEGDSIKPAIYSQKENNTETVLAPNFSVLGECVPEEFYETLDENMISSGLLPRFIIIEYDGQRPDLNEDFVNAFPEFSLVEQLAALASHSHTLMHANKSIKVKLDEQATQDARAYEKLTTKLIRSADRDIIAQLWNRSHIKALKLAALVAVGINPYEPQITREHLEWSISLVTHDILNLVKRFEAGLIGKNNEETEQQAWLQRVIKQYYISDYSEAKRYGGNENFYLAKIIPYMYIQRKCVAQSPFRHDRGGATNAIKRTLQNFCDNGTLVEVPRAELQKKYNTIQRGFMLANPKLLEVAEDD